MCKDRYGQLRKCHVPTLSKFEHMFSRLEGCYTRTVPQPLYKINGAQINTLTTIMDGRIVPAYRPMVSYSLGYE